VWGREKNAGTGGRLERDKKKAPAESHLKKAVDTLTRGGRTGDTAAVYTGLRFSRK